MVRWVERKGSLINFGNIVGAYSGPTYSYRFPSEDLAMNAELHLNGRSDGMPNPFGPDQQKRLKAIEVTK